MSTLVLKLSQRGLNPDPQKMCLVLRSNYRIALQLLKELDLPKLIGFIKMANSQMAQSTD